MEKSRDSIFTNHQWLKPVLFVVLLVNLYLITHVFVGKNSVINYIKYKREIAKKTEQKMAIIKRRYQIEQISTLLRQKEPDLDTLEDLLRQTAQASRPDEKIVMLRDES